MTGEVLDRKIGMFGGVKVTIKWEDGKIEVVKGGGMKSYDLMTMMPGAKVKRNEIGKIVLCTPMSMPGM